MKTIQLQLGASTLIKSSSKIESLSKLVLIAENKVFMTFRDGTDNTKPELWGTIITIEGVNISVGELLQLCIDIMYPTLINIILNDNKIIIFHHENSQTNTKIITISVKKLINKLSSTNDKIVGIAKTSGTEGQTVDIYVPQIGEEV
ncbi:MAG: hypothetical protein HFJ50_00160 [Clostridia bacterium]|jgi:hypothetical protein|nr:hypothetical protein [Clostridia bacterium]